MALKIAVIVGSLRKDSLNKKVAKALVALAPESASTEFIEIGHLPLYNPDLDEGDQTPAAWDEFRNIMKTFDAILFVTPEYNRSVPASLKNALDVGSRPYGQSIWDGKPCAIVSASPGAVGGFGANHHLRQSLVFLNMPALQQPEAYLGGADKYFDAEGNVTNEKTAEILKRFMAAFVAWIERTYKGAM